MFIDFIVSRAELPLSPTCLAAVGVAPLDVWPTGRVEGDAGPGPNWKGLLVLELWPPKLNVGALC